MSEIAPLLEVLAVAFAGGVFGACVGGVAAFSLCGLSALVGVAIRLAGGGPAFDAMVPWGPFLGPQAAFVGAVAAAALAGRRGLIASGRDVLAPLAPLGSLPVLLVGGVGGVIGQAVYLAIRANSASLPPPGLDAMAAAVAVSTLGIRLVLGRVGAFGIPGACETRWKPSEASLWIPAQSKLEHIALLAVAVAVPAAWLPGALPGATGLVFALSALSLAALLAGHKVPVTLHMALAAETAVLVWGGWLAPVAAAVACGLLAEGFARLFLVYGDTHIDPPAWAIATTGVIMVLLVSLTGTGPA